MTRYVIARYSYYSEASISIIFVTAESRKEALQNYYAEYYELPRTFSEMSVEDILQEFYDNEQVVDITEVPDDF